jgi:hypothetical protein
MSGEPCAYFPTTYRAAGHRARVASTLHMVGGEVLEARDGARLEAATETGLS